MVTYANQLSYLADLPFVKDRLLSWRFTTAQDLEGTPNITTAGTLTIPLNATTTSRITTTTKTVASSRVIVPIWKVSNLVNQRGTVTILASTDGGTTYPHVLTSGQRFLLPAATTSLKFAIDLTPNVISETFNRANAQLSASPITTPSGDTWQGATSGYSISSLTLTNTAVNATIYLPSATSSTLFQCDCNYANSSVTQGWLWRFQDINNFFYLQHNLTSTIVYRRIAGSDTVVASLAGVTGGGTTHPYSVANNPTTGTYTLSRSGSPIFTNTDLNLAAAGGVGILNGASTSSGFHDNVLSVTGSPVQLEYFGVYLES